MTIFGQKKRAGMVLVFFVLFAQPVAAEGWKDSFRQFFSATRQRVVSYISPLQHNRGLLNAVSWTIVYMTVMDVPRLAGGQFLDLNEYEEYKAFLTEIWDQQCSIVSDICCQSLEDLRSDLIRCIPLENITELYEGFGADISDLWGCESYEPFCRCIQEWMWVILTRPHEVGIRLNH